MAWAETPTVTLIAQMEATGEVTVRASSRQAGLDLTPVLGAVLHCQGKMKSRDELFGEFRCSHPMQRDGLSLQAVFDLAPIAQKLAPADEIQLWLEYPRLGFETSSTPLKDEGSRWSLTRTAQFTVGDIPGPIHIQFGYHPDQLAIIYLPLAALALALTLIPMSLSRAGLAELNRSVFMLGTILWLGAASRLQAADPLRILLSGTSVANLAAELLAYCSPLLCVAAGAAWGGRKRVERRPREIFAEM